ncbi:MAG: hypothetical protein JXQ65_02025 [Candidatus Marinimicrobia bacterium]|nr:hypothetical protein [Candidatus Neomarinimicrobiota bacterium]
MTTKGSNIITILLLVAVIGFAQDNPRVIELKRGAMWHAFHYAQECEPLYDWRTTSYGLDWPGYDIKEMSADIGGTYNYLIAGGFFISALRTIDPDTVQGWMDFCVNGDRNTSWEQGKQPFLAKQHKQLYSKGENYYLATDINEAEETIISEWEKDPQYSDYHTSNKKFNINVTRTIRQWSGSQADENYLIAEYTIKSVPTEVIGLDSAVVLFSYAMSPTDRGWNYTNPNYLSGARNAISEYDEDQRLVTCRAGDYRNTNNDESYDFFEYQVYNAVTQKYEMRSEFMAPGKMGIKLLDAKLNGADIDVKFTWNAAVPNSDYEGPFAGVAGMDNKYNAMKDPSRLREAFDDPNDPRMGDSRLYANFAIGPINLRGRGRGELKVVIAEFVGGADLNETRTLPFDSLHVIDEKADSAAEYLSDRVSFNYEHEYKVPMPPPGPEFDVYAGDVHNSVQNIIAFTDSIESINDPHQGIPDVAGYRIYRSAEYPFGPWEKIADIPVGSSEYYADGVYEFKDNQVALGYGYYYSVTSYDTGHEAWAVDNAVTVPSLESSIFANRKKTKFYTTLKPLSEDESMDKVVVVPNPFYVSSGLASSADAKLIQFVNVPEECTIRIFTIRGDLVKTIEHYDPTSGVATWNQISNNNQYVKSGMYFYHIESEQGETRGKFAIIN